MASDTAPVLSLRKRTCSHVSPPSRERYTPRSGFRPKGLPRAAAYTRSGSVGWTTIFPMAPDLGRPTKRHDAPPSSLFQAPRPTETFPRMHAEPVPT